MAGTVRELQARFTATMGGMRSAIRTVQRDIQGISGVTSRSVRDSNREFQRLETKLEMLPGHLKGFGKELHNTRKEMKDTFKYGTRSLDEMSTAATKSSVALNKITSVTKTGKSAIKTVQDLGEATRETQLAILGLNRDGTVKISTEETTRRLAKFKDELADSKRQLEALRDAGDFASYEAGMQVVEKKLKDVDRAMFAAAKGGQAYTDMINRLGVHTSDAANQMAIRMEAYKDQFIRSVDLMNAKSNQSKKMMDILPETSMFQTADRFFLGIGNRLEDVAKKGSAANIALRMLGRNASMKDLNDRIMLINQGLMRMNMLGLGMGIAFAGFTTSMISLSNAVDGRLVPAASEFKKTWLDALTPFAQVWTDFALMVVKAGTSVGQFVQKLNELNPAISESIGMFAFLFTGLSVILSPMAIGIGRAEGMRAAFSSLFLIIKPFVLGFLRIAATASIVSGALVLIGGVFIKLWKNSENLRAAMMSLWETLKEAGATIAAPFVKAFKMIADEVTKLLNKMVGSDAKNMASFWQTIGDKIAVGVNKIRDAIKPVADKIADVVDAFVEWEGFLPVIAGLTAAFVTYKGTVAAVTAATKAWNLIQKASVALMGMMRGAMIAYTLAGGGLQGVLAVVTAAQRALNLSMMMNPVGLIIAALVGLGVAFVVAYKKSETFRNFVDKLWSAIKTGASFVLNWLKTNWPMLLAIITGPIGLIVYAVVKHWDAIKNATITAFNAVKNFFSDFFTKMKIMFNLHVALFINNFNMLKTGLINIATRIRDSVVNFFTDLWTKAKIMFNLHVALLINNFNMLKTGLVNIVTRIRDSIVNFFTDLWNKIKIMFNLHVALLINNFNILKNNLINIALNIRDRIVSFFNDLWTKIKNIFNNIKTFLTNVWNGIKTSVSGIVQSIVSAIKKSWDDVKTRTSSVFNAIKQFLSDVWNGIKNTVSKLANSAKDSVVNAWNTLKNRTTEMFNNIKSKVTNIFDDIVGAAKKLPGRIGDGIKSMASGVKKGVTSFANTLVKAMGKGLNGTITGINWVLEKVGAPTIKKWEVPKYAKGTGNGKHGGGLAWLGDGGEHELYRTPKGQVGLSPDTDTLMNLPKGTEVLSGKQTKQAFAAANVPMYDGGSGVIGGIKKGASWVADKGQEVYEHAKDKTVETAGKVKDLALDVWDYMDDPVALMKKVFGKFIPDLPNLAGAAGDMLKGGVKTVKDKSIDFIKSKLDEYMSFDDGGGDGSTVGPGSGYGGMHPYVEAWYKKVKDKFGPTKFMGGYSNRNMVGGKSKSMHAYGRAFDIGGSGATMSKIAEYLRTQAKNIQYVIYNHRSSKMGGAWKPYGGGGKNPHTDHVHADFLPGGGGGGSGATGGNYVGKYASIIRSAAARFGVSPALVAGIIKQESKFNPNARSPVGATGLMQLMPATARSMGVKNPRDPQQNITGGTKYISQMLRMFHNDTALGLAAYNAGPGNVKKYGGIPPFRETQNYVRIVMANARGFGAQFKGYYKGARVAGKQLAWIAEKGAEYVIPTDGGQRAYDLWQQAGLENNFIGGSTTNNSGGINITMPVTINGGATPQDAKMFVSTALPMIKKELIKDMKNDSYKRGMKR